METLRQTDDAINICINCTKLHSIYKLPRCLVHLDLSTNNIQNIWTSFPETLTYLDLSYNAITFLHSLKELTSLKYLNLCSNYISELPELPDSIEKLNISHNKIQNIKQFPKSLLDFDACYNKIISIPEFPNVLITISLTSNLLTEIQEVPLTVTKLFLIGNVLKECPKLHEGLTEVSIAVNKIKYISYVPSTLTIFDFSMNNIQSIDQSINRLRNCDICYHGNPLDNVSPNIIRFLIKRSYKKTLYNDSQSVHDHSIQESIRESLLKIFKNNYVDYSVQDILEDPLLHSDTKELLVSFFDDETLYCDFTFHEIFNYFYHILRSNKDSKEIYNILNVEMKDSACKCFVGRLSRLINTFNGFIDDISIKISDHEQISNIIISTRNVIIPYNVEDHKRIVTERLQELNYENDVIQEWISFIE